MTGRLRGRVAGRRTHADGLPFFRRVVELVDRLSRPWQRVEHTIQTNATLIDDEWARFLADDDVLVGVSVDGPRQLHDAYGVDKAGKPSTG